MTTLLNSDMSKLRLDNLALFFSLNENVLTIAMHTSSSQLRNRIEIPIVRHAASHVCVVIAYP